MKTNCLHCNGKGTVNKFVRPQGTNRDGEYRDYPCPFCWFETLTDEELTELYGVPTKRINTFTVTVEPHGEVV